MSQQRKGGPINLQINGVTEDARGNFTWGLGRMKAEAVLGSNGPVGYKETATTPFIEGEIIDRADLDLAAMLDLRDATVSIVLPNGKTVTLFDAYFNGEGVANSEEGNIAVRFEGKRAEEISP